MDKGCEDKVPKNKAKTTGRPVKIELELSMLSYILQTETGTELEENSPE